LTNNLNILIILKSLKNYDDANDVTTENLKQCNILIQSGYNDILENENAVEFKNYKGAKQNGVTTQIASCSASQVIAYNISVEIIKNKKNRRKIDEK